MPSPRPQYWCPDQARGRNPEGDPTKYLVARYAKDEDTPETVTDVSPVGADAFAELLAVPADRLTDVYPLRPEHADGLHRLTGVALDLDRFEYFLEAEAD
ncbi:DUF7683 domain-containing protein [Streptomyces sp. 900105755]